MKKKIKKNKKSLDKLSNLCYNKYIIKQNIQTKKGIDTMMKMTYVKALEIAMNCEEIKANAEVFEKLEALKGSISKKNSAERKPTTTQKANEGYKEAIVSFMEQGQRFTISELMKDVVELEGLTNQRVSALVRQLKDEGLVVRTEEKRKAYFSLAEVE